MNLNVASALGGTASAPRMAKAAKEFQASMLAELLKPLGPAMVGHGDGETGTSTTLEFYGFLMLDAIARDLAARDILRLDKPLIERMSRGNPPGDQN